MTAKDYYNLFPSDPAKHANELVNALNAEARHMANVRNVTTNDGVRAIIIEQNDKWNKFIELHIKKHGFCPLAINGYKSLWVQESKAIHDEQEKEKALAENATSIIE